MPAGSTGGDSPPSVECSACGSPIATTSRFCSQCGAPAPGQPVSEHARSPQGRAIFDRLSAVTRGRYEILDELGHGGMAVVFRAHQKSMDREVAIKVLLPRHGFDANIVERFQREAKTQGKLEHPNIISVYEVHEEGGLTYFTMTRIEGPSLRDRLREQGPMPIPVVVRYLSQAAEALGYAHRRRVVHRDVKPDNILIDPELDSVVLTDFGIAKAVSAENTLTTPGDMMGTPSYMSPEQGEGLHDVDGRADQYSLGMIGYEMLTGKKAFSAESVAQLVYMHRFEEPENLDALRPDAPDTLRGLIHRAIKKDRNDRFESMSALVDALRRVPTELTARPPGAVQRSIEDVTSPVPVGFHPTLAEDDVETLNTKGPPDTFSGVDDISSSGWQKLEEVRIEVGEALDNAAPETPVPTLQGPTKMEDGSKVLLSNSRLVVTALPGHIYLLEPRSRLDRELFKVTLRAVWDDPDWAQPWGFVVLVNKHGLDADIRNHEMPPRHLRSVGTAIVTRSSLYRMLINSLGKAFRMVEGFEVSAHDTPSSAIARQRELIEVADRRGRQF